MRCRAVGFKKIIIIAFQSATVFLFSFLSPAPTQQRVPAIHFSHNAHRAISVVSPPALVYTASIPIQSPAATTTKGHASQDHGPFPAIRKGVARRETDAPQQLDRWSSRCGPGRQPTQLVTSVELGGSEEAPWRSIAKDLRRDGASRQPGTMARQSQLRRWAFAGCQLCFLVTGKAAPGHTMEGCGWGSVTPFGEAAGEVLCWLESLRLPRFLEGRGSSAACSLCVGTGMACGEAREVCGLLHGDAAQSADARSRITDTGLG